MLPEKIRDYFSFTKKERVGVISLIALIIIIFILPYFFSSSKNKNNKQDFEQFKNEIGQLKIQKQDSTHFAVREEKKEDESNSDYYEPSHKKEAKIKVVLFYFDPNTASEQDWKRLGLRDKTIHTIQNYLSKGGKFHKPEDLQKIYGLHENEYQQLQTYVKIENRYSSGHEERIEKINNNKLPVRKEKIFEVIDVNEADTAAFIALPGIGSKLANRIITFREKLGGFYSVGQIGETYNLPDSTFQKIKPFLKMGDKQVRKININTADANTLKTHPYIRWNLANAIVQYRSQHGDYKSVDDLKQIAVITPEIFEKISKYLETNNR